jgi:diketogulonate reductase-like aldo/keto reductase
MNLPQPLLGMGTWGMGGTWENDPSNIEESIEILKEGLSLGLKIIDVAELYGAGLTEEIVGKAISGKRESAYIISKVWKTNMHYEGVLKAAENSLKRLGTSYIDLYLIHWPNPDIPLKETMEALELLKDRGLIRAIGVSNFSAELMDEANSYLQHSTLSVSQFEYNLYSRGAERDVIPYCREHGIDMIAYKPLARFNPGSLESEIINEISSKYKKTKAQVMLNWVLSQGIAVIPKTSNIEHLKENIGATGWSMLKDDIDALRNIA